MGFKQKLLTGLVVSAALTLSAGLVQAATGDKPNILVVWGDDIG